MRISLSKLDWISSGYIFFIQETEGIQQSRHLYTWKIDNGGWKKGILWGPVSVSSTINMNSIKNKSETLGKLTREMTDT